jgi:serine O-acetyltransferase
MKVNAKRHPLKEVVDKLAEQDSYNELFHSNAFGEQCPSAISLKQIVLLSREIFFPGYYGEERICKETVSYYTGVKCTEILSLLRKQIAAGFRFGLTDDELISPSEINEKATEAAIEVIKQFPKIRETLATDVIATYNGDPAATSTSEVILCYPSIKAIANYRLAHAMYMAGVPIIPRLIAEMAHSETGIDIHPAAQIGNYFSIDHGTGVVVGATTIIGDNVKLYQGVTLGARSFPLDENGLPIKGIQRHPILENDVVVYSNATILGCITVGRGAVVGGNIWVTQDVAPGARISQRNKETNY